MSLLPDEIKAYVDLAVRKAIANVQTAVGTVVTSPSQVSTDPLAVVLDGGSVAVPVKMLRATPIFPGARVALVRFGSDWTVIGAYTNPGAGTGSSRIAIGSDVPAELRSFGIDTAILIYITDKTSGLEVGYFFIAGSNRFDGNGDNRVMAFGNVTYPTPGNPASATTSNVKTNFQANMNSPYPQTIFKDQEVDLWTGLVMSGFNGGTKIQYDRTDNNLGVRIDDGGVQAGQPSTTNVETWHAATLQNSWANVGGYAATKYRKLASPPNSVEIIGHVSGGTSANATVLFNLPTGYRPANAQRNVVYAFGGTLNIATETPSLDTGTGGNVTLLACVNASVLTFHFTVSLDA